MADRDAPIDRLRRICLGLPEATERLSHGEPAFFVLEKKTFVTFANHHHDDRLAFWCAAPDGFQRMLVEAEPDRFFVPPYVGHRGWLGVYLDVPVPLGRDPHHRRGRLPRDRPAPVRRRAGRYTRRTSVPQMRSWMACFRPPSPIMNALMIAGIRQSANDR